MILYVINIYMIFRITEANRCPLLLEAQIEHFMET